MNDDILTAEDQSKHREARKKLTEEVGRLRDEYGKRRNWPEIEKILLTEEHAFVATTLASGFLKDKEKGQRERVDKDKADDIILSELHQDSFMKMSYYQSGMSRDDIAKYFIVIDEIFIKTHLPETIV